MVLSSSTFRKNWTFESMMPEAPRDDQVDGLTAFLPRLDRAVLELASQPIGFGDKAAAIHAGKIREIDLVRSPFAGEYLAALVRARGPCASELERVELGGACHDCRSKDQVSKHNHRLFT